MALVINDRVKETTTTTGTGAVSLGGATTGFEAFSAGVGNSNTTYYVIAHQTANEWEVGLGTLDGDSSDLTRTTIISSSNSDSAVDFAAGTKDVFCTVPASKLLVEDANNDITIGRNLTVTGDLTISGDDLTMGTNTSGAALIGDGTNFNPVAISGDITIGTTGTAAIGSGVIVNADVNSSAAIAMSKTAFTAGTGVSLSTNTLNVDAAQTGITSILATDVKIGEDDQTKVDFETANTINFYADNEKQLILTDGALAPGSNAIVDLGTDALEFKDAYFDGTVETDALSIAGTAITTTAAEINLIDGGTSRGTTAVASGDGILINDGGTMRMTNVDTVSTYFASHSVGGSNIVTTGALDSGSITSGFGTIDTGSSTITTTGLITGGSLDIDNVLINGTTIGHTDDTDLMTVADGLLTVAGEISVTTLDIGGTNVTSTAAELNILDGVTATTAELNYNDIATLGTTAASKTFTADANNLTKITGGVYLEEATLSFDATQDWDVRASPIAKVTLTNNVTFDAPTNPTTGQYISIVCIQDGTGSRTIAWNAVFEFKDDTAPTATTTASKGDMFTFRYNGAKWLEVGRNLNLTLS